MKKRPQPHGNHERWVLSYADFMTLLFAFFVVLYSSAEVDKAKMASLSNAIASGFQDLGVGAGQGAAPIVIPGTNPAAFTHPARPQPATDIILRKLEADLAPELQNHTVSLRQTPEGLVLSLHEIGFFDSGSSGLRASSLDTFDRIGSVIASVGSNLRIEGHTDNIPISHRPLPLQLGALHRPRRRDHSYLHHPRTHRSRASLRRRLCRVPPRGRQLHRRRTPPQPPRRYRHHHRPPAANRPTRPCPGPKRTATLTAPSGFFRRRITNCRVPQVPRRCLSRAKVGSSAFHP